MNTPNQTQLFFNRIAQRNPQLINFNRNKLDQTTIVNKLYNFRNILFR